MLSLLINSQSSSDHLHQETINHLLKFEETFSVLSKEAWSTMLLQIVRVFVAQNINIKSYRVLPGVDKDDSKLAWSASMKLGGFYSQSDSILLRWVSYHVYQVWNLKSNE
jgi:hypothetical protein